MRVASRVMGLGLELGLHDQTASLIIKNTNGAPSLTRAEEVGL